MCTCADAAVLACTGCALLGRRGAGCERRGGHAHVRPRAALPRGPSPGPLGPTLVPPSGGAAGTGGGRRCVFLGTDCGAHRAQHGTKTIGRNARPSPKDLRPRRSPTEPLRLHACSTLSCVCHLVHSPLGEGAGLAHAFRVRNSETSLAQWSTTPCPAKLVAPSTEHPESLVQSFLCPRRFNF